MKEKLKIENSGTVSVLDGIGCGCGSCDDDKPVKESVKEEKEVAPAPPVQANVLDDIGCG